MLKLSLRVSESVLRRVAQLREWACSGYDDCADDTASRREGRALTINPGGCLATQGKAVWGASCRESV